MSALVPPPRFPGATTGDGDGGRDFRVRSTQVVATLGTLLATAYVCSFGAIPAILALSVAKHVLVAVLLMGLGTHDRELR